MLCTRLPFMCWFFSKISEEHFFLKFWDIKKKCKVNLCGSATCLSNKFPVKATYKCSVGPELLPSGNRFRQNKNHHKNNEKFALNPLFQYSVQLLYNWSVCDFQRAINKKLSWKSHFFPFVFSLVNGTALPRKKSEMSDKCCKNFFAVSFVFKDTFVWLSGWSQKRVSNVCFFKFYFNVLQFILKPLS